MSQGLLLARVGASLFCHLHAVSRASVQLRTYPLVTPDMPGHSSATDTIDEETSVDYDSSRDDDRFPWLGSLTRTNDLEPFYIAVQGRFTGVFQSEYVSLAIDIIRDQF